MRLFLSWAAALLALAAPASALAQSAAPSSAPAIVPGSPADRAIPPWITTGDVLQVQAEGDGQTVRVRISGDDEHADAAGKDVTLRVQKSGFSGIELDPGDRVVLRAERTTAGELKGTVVERTHGGLWIVLVLTILVALLIGRRQGAGAVLPAVFSLLVIVFLLLPLILRGLAPLWAAAIPVFVVASVLAIVSFGWNRASLATVAGAAASLLLTALVGWGYTSLSALDSLTSPALDLLRGLPGLRLETLPLASSLLVAVGAVTHVVHRITARVFLEHRQHPDRELLQLLDVGITQGRTIFPSVVEAALWVLFGATLPLLILSAAQVSVFHLFMYGDPVRLMVGFATLVTGLALSIPIATVTAALFASNER